MSYIVSLSKNHYEYRLKSEPGTILPPAETPMKAYMALEEEAKAHGNNTEYFAEAMGLDKHKFWAYLVQVNELDDETAKKTGLTAWQIANGIVKLDLADGVNDGNIDASKVSATTTAPTPAAPTSGGATAPANLNGTVDASNVLTLTKNGNYEAIANYLIGNTAHAAKIAELETKRGTYNAANGTNLTQTQYVAKLVRQVTTDAYPNKPEARYPDAKLSINLNDVLDGTLDKAKDDIQEAKAKKTSGRGQKKVANKKPVEEVTPPTPETPAATATEPAAEEEVPEEAVAAKPTWRDRLSGRTGLLLALLLGGAAVAVGIQQTRANQMQMPPQGPVYSNVPPNQGLFGRNPFNAYS